MRLICSTLVVSSLLCLSGCPADDDAPIDASSSGTSGMTTGAVASTSGAAASSDEGSTSDDPSNTSNLESSEGGVGGESTEGCDVIEDPGSGFCSCDDCGPPEPLGCDPLTVFCSSNKAGTTLSEGCVDPTTEDDAAVDCILNFIASNTPIEATASWQIVLDESPPITAYFSRHALSGSSSLAWTFGTDGGAWANSGVTSETGLADEARACLELEDAEHVACLHRLVDLLDPATCFDPVPEECA